MNREERGLEIDLFQIAIKLLENVKYIILTTVIFAILGYVGTIMFITPVYQAGGKLLVNSRRDDTVNITNDQLNSSRNLVDTYAVIIRSRDVLNQVINELNLQESYGQLADSISVKSVNNTPVMQIYVKHTNRETALLIASKLLEIAPDVLVETTEAGSVKAVENAHVGANPVSPSEVKNTVLMAIVGFAITCLIIVIMALSDNTYKSELDIQRDLNIPVLGTIPEMDSFKSHSKQKRIRKGSDKK